MENASRAEPAALSFDIEYQGFTGAANLDLRGKGKLIIHPAAPSYRFLGDRRAVFGESTAIELFPEEIRNVAVEGRKVEFATSAGTSGRKRKPFVFYCRTASAAAEVAGLLPATRDDAFVTNQDFAQKLQTLPGATSPWSSITHIIVAANVAAFVIMGLLGAGWLIPADMTPYIRYVANNGGATTDGEWWRILTSMFVHYGAIHLLLNMWALFQTGHFVERLFGRALFALGYLGSGIVASFTSLFWHGDQVWSAGASGAVFGVYGMLLGFILREKQSVPKSVLRPLFTSTLSFAGYNLLFGLAHPRIDNAAHLGGLLGGVALGWLVALPIDAAARRRLTAARLKLGATVLLAAVVLAVAQAPRFDYRFREELAWTDANRALAQGERRLLEEQKRRIANLRPGEPAPEFTAWIAAEILPYYQRWREELAGLRLTVGMRTEQRRQSLTTLIDAKLRNYRRLVEDLQANEPNAVQRYLRAEEEAHAAARAPHN